MKGCRLLATPEVEKEATVKSIWLKLLSDRATTWVGRDLYMSNVKFRIPGLLSICSNVKVAYSSVDGGLARRTLAVQWPVSFKSVALHLDERVRHKEDIKQGQFYTDARKAGFITFLTALIRVYFHESNGLDIRPPQVRDAAEEALHLEYTSAIRDFVQERFEAAEPLQGITKLEFMKKLQTFMLENCESDFRPTQAQMEKASGTVVVFKIPRGSTMRAQRISDRSYLKWKPE